MAGRRKKKRSRRRGRRRARSSGPKAKPLGLAGGAAIVGTEMLMKRNPTYHAPLDYVLNPDVPFDASNTVNSLVTNVKDVNRYKFGLYGMLISASPRIPIIGIVARPVNNGLKRLTKGKWGL